VVGGGNSAGQAVMFLAEHTAGASLLLRGGDLRKNMSDYLARRIQQHPKIEVVRHVQVDAVEGGNTVSKVRLRHLKDGTSRDLDCSAVVVFIGAQPRTDWLPPSVAVDSKGFIFSRQVRPLAPDRPRAPHRRNHLPGRLRRRRRPRPHHQTGRLRRRRRRPGVTCAHRVHAEI
jgi:thioredoxin reductase (NADPH)